VGQCIEQGQLGNKVFGSGYPAPKKAGYPKISVRLPDPDIRRFPTIRQPCWGNLFQNRKQAFYPPNSTFLSFF